MFAPINVKGDNSGRTLSSTVQVAVVRRELCYLRISDLIVRSIREINASSQYKNVVLPDIGLFSKSKFL